MRMMVLSCDYEFGYGSFVPVDITTDTGNLGWFGLCVCDAASISFPGFRIWRVSPLARTIILCIPEETGCGKSEYDLADEETKMNGQGGA